MKKRLKQAWQSRSPRERTIIAVLSAFVIVALYAALLLSANRARPQLRANVLALRTDALVLEKHAEEIERLRSVRPPAASQTDLRALVQAQAGSAGLAGALVRIDAPEPNRIQVVFGAVPFPALMNWIAALGAQHIRLETGRIEALSKPGMVSATATFVRAGQQ